MTPRWEKEDGGGQICVTGSELSSEELEKWCDKTATIHKESHGIRQGEFSAEQQTTHPTAALQEKEQCFSSSQTKGEEKIIKKIVKSQAVEWDKHPATHLIEPGRTKPSLSVPTAEHLWAEHHLQRAQRKWESGTGNYHSRQS